MRSAEQTSAPYLVQFYLSLCGLEKWILVWPKGGRLPTKTMHRDNYEPSEATMWWVEKMMVFVLALRLPALVCPDSLIVGIARPGLPV